MRARVGCGLVYFCVPTGCPTHERKTDNYVDFDVVKSDRDRDPGLSFVGTFCPSCFLSEGATVRR